MGDVVGYPYPVRFSSSRRKPGCILLLAAFLGLVAGKAHPAAPEPVTLKSGIDSVPLAGHITELHDEQGAWTPENIRSPELAARFSVVSGDTINHGISQQTYWYRLLLRNSDSEATDWAVGIGIPTLDYVDIHVLRSSGETETTLTGDRRHRPLNQLPGNPFIIPLRLSAGEEVTIYVRVHTTGRHQVFPWVWSETGLLKFARSRNRSMGFFYGVMLVMVFYNLFVYLVIRDRAYSYYVFFILAMAGVLAIFSGDAQQYGNDLSPEAPRLINVITPICMALLSLSAILFGQHFMQTRDHAPRMHRFLSLLAGATLITTMLSPLMSHLASLRLNTLLLAAAFLSLLTVSGALALKGVRPARFYLLAWSGLFAALALFLLASVGVIATRLRLFDAVPGGLCVLVTLLSLALADRVATERRERERFARLKQYLPQKVADLVVQEGEESLLQAKRRKVTVLVMDLRGFTPFSETTAPEDVMAVLREFYETMGAIVEKHGGTVEHFAGDSMLIFFNAPLEIPEPEKQAIETALEMRQAFEGLRSKWARHGHDLGLGIGIADGYATIGAIGFSGRSQYAAIGAVTNLASRLCSSAKHGETLTTARVLAEVENLVQSESAGEQAIKGFARPIQVLRVLGFKANVGSGPSGLEPTYRST